VVHMGQSMPDSGLQVLKAFHAVPSLHGSRLVGAARWEGRERVRERVRNGETPGYDHQPSQFEQIVDLKISDLPCGRPRDLEIDYLLEL